jgi:diguanylate cyclase
VLSGIKFAIDPYRALHAAGGQEAADRAMREVAQVLIAAARPGDLLVRLDAEHLGLVAPGLSIDEAVAWADAIRARVQSDAAASGAGTPSALRLTVSAGVDALPSRAPAIATLIERAGKALLRAKRQGPNLVSRFTTTAAAKAASDQEPLAAAESLDS